MSKLEFVLGYLLLVAIGAIILLGGTLRHRAACEYHVQPRARIRAPRQYRQQPFLTIRGDRITMREGSTTA